MAETVARVLLVDDDESTFIITRELFDERYPGQFQFDWAGSFDDGLAAINRSQHDVYLIDQRLGGRSGIDLLKAAAAAGCRSPMIVMTGQDSREIDVLAMEAGASDFLIKDVYDVSRLEHAIRFALERQRLLAALEHERDLLRALMENLPDSIYFKDAQSRFLQVSHSKAARSGLSDPAEAVGKTDFDFFTLEDAQASFADEQEIMRTNQAVVAKEERHVWPDGSETWVTTSKLPFRDKQGNVLGTFGISHDITEHKQILQALRDNEFRTRRIVETALDAFIAIDHEGTIIDWNAQATTVFGWSPQEALGQTLAYLIIPIQFRANFQAGMQRYLTTGQSRILNQRLEMTALHRNGREFPVEITISPLHLNETILFAAFIHDITKRKAAEAALNEAKEAAEAASRAKNDFLANMSHEIRTPMNAVLGMTELVLDTPLTPSQHEYLTMVHDSGENLLQLINEILDYSKIEAGKLELVPDLFNVREMLGDAMKSLAVRAERTNLELAFRVAADIPELLVGDAGRLRQIVVNLVGNAIKFTQHGEVVLDVSRADEEELNSEPSSTASDSIVSATVFPAVTPAILVHFYVCDTGIGIPVEKRGLIFEAFEQADSSTTRKYGGTGLGLAIAKQLVELMGGRIWVDSEVGIGSTFHFMARLIVPPVSADTTPVQSIVMHGTRVLIVDDNATNRLILEEMLKNWGLVPVCAASARQAIEALRTAARIGEPFSVVLSDLHMPDADGFMLADDIRKDSLLAKTLIVMLTSGQRPGDVERSQQLDISAYLLKPVKQSELFDALVAALGVNAPEGDLTPLPSSGTLDQTGPLRLLLAEDSIPNQKLAVGLLSKWGHHVTVANHGREALQLWESPPDGKPFNAVLMDVQMPEMDGFEATAAIRERETRSGQRTPIIAMTAHAMKGDRERCLAAGMDGYVSKPIRQQELLSILAQLSTGREPSQPATTERAIEPSSEQSLTSESPLTLNWSKALSAVAGDQELLVEVMQAFLQEGAELCPKMRIFVENGNWLGLGKAAHQLQAALRMFGGSTLDLAVSLETMCKKGLAEESQGLFAMFNEELENVFREVRQFLKGS